MQANTGQNQNNSQGSQKPGLSWSQPSVPPSTTQPKVVPPPVTPASNNRTSNTVPEKSNTGTYVGIFVAGLIIGALIGWGITSSKNGGSTTSSTASSTSMTDTASTSTSNTTATSSINLSGSTIGASSIVVVSPQQSGFAVNVSNVTVMQPTWVVIYEDRADAPGNVLGAALFLPQSGNNTQSGTVQLLRATMPGQKYFAGETADDGDKIFSLQSDKPERDTQGNLLLTQFSTN